MKLSPLVFAFTSLAFAMLFQPAQAASSCKGLENTICGKQAHCSWTQSYIKKDGKKVKGYCRTARKHPPSSTKKIANKSIGKN